MTVFEKLANLATLDNAHTSRGRGQTLTLLAHPTSYTELSACASIAGYDQTLAIDPVTTSKIYFGNASGAYYSTDSGAHWNTFSSILTDTSVSVLLLDPQDPSQIYAGTERGLFVSATP